MADNTGEYTPDLLPCPFCGAEAEMDNIEEDCNRRFAEVRVRCSEGCTSRRFSRVQSLDNNESYGSHKTKLRYNVAKLWNTRVDPQS